MFQGFSRFFLLNKLANVKNVFYGYYENDPVVVKHLAHDSEIAEFDKKHYDPTTVQNQLTNQDAVLKVQDVKGKLLTDLSNYVTIGSSNIMCLFLSVP